MAKPIEPTPEIMGRDAENFLKLTLQAQTTPNAEHSKFLEECRKLYSERKP